MDDQTKRLRGGAVEVCPECDIAGCRHIRARAALAAQPAASAEPSDESILRVADDVHQTGWNFDGVPDGLLIDFARALLSRYGRPAGDAVAADEITYEIWQDDMMVASSTDPKDASHYAAVYSQDGPVKVYTVLRSEWEGPNGGIVRGAGQMSAGDAQPVAIVKENPYCPEGLSDEINEYLPNGTVLYAAPVAVVAAQKSDDARDAERWREVERQATKNTAFDRYGDGAYWSVGVFSDDSRQTFGETIDAAIAQQRKGE